MTCTWKDCNSVAEHLQLDKNGKEWANLCKAHFNEFETALDDFITSGDPKKTLRVWVLASGGSKKISEKILHKGD